MSLAAAKKKAQAEADRRGVRVNVYQAGTAFAVKAGPGKGRLIGFCTPGVKANRRRVNPPVPPGGTRGNTAGDATTKTATNTSGNKTSTSTVTNTTNNYKSGKNRPLTRGERAHRYLSKLFGE